MNGQTYDYHRPENLEEALRLKAQTPDARFIAGGTDLMVRLREGRYKPPALISLRGVPELRSVEVGETTRIGALCTVNEVAAHAALIERFPVLARAAKTLGSTQIRNAATLGGNLCNASPCADMATPLLVLDAQVRITSPSGSRKLSLDEFFIAPGETRLAADEVLTELLLGAPADGARATFLKKSRVQMDIAVASVSVLLEFEGANCSRARVAAGSVAPKPLQLRTAEAALEGRVLTDDVIESAVAATRGDVAPITDLRGTADYRRHIVGVFVKRAIAQLMPNGATDGEKASAS